VINLQKILLISIGLLLSSMLFLSCTNDYSEILSEIDYSQKPIQEVENIQIVRTDSGRIVFRMTAPVVERYTHLEKEPYELFPKGMTVETFSDYPSVESSLTCDYAINQISKDLWEARDNVVVVTVDGDTVKTEQMFWDMKAERIYSDKYVNIRRENEIIYGEGFESNQTLSNGRIVHFKGSFNLDE